MTGIAKIQDLVCSGRITAEQGAELIELRRSLRRSLRRAWWRGFLRGMDPTFWWRRWRSS